MLDWVIDVVHWLSCCNKDGFVYTYNDYVIIPDDAPNNQHYGDESSDDEDGPDYVDTDSMSRMDNVDYLPNIDDA